MNESGGKGALTSMGHLLKAIAAGFFMECVGTGPAPTHSGSRLSSISEIQKVVVVALLSPNTTSRLRSKCLPRTTTSILPLSGLLSGLALSFAQC